MSASELSRKHFFRYQRQSEQSNVPCGMFKRFEIIGERMRARDRHYMKADMLESQFSNLEEPDDAIEIDIRESPQGIVDRIEYQLTGAGKLRG